MNNEEEKEGGALLNQQQPSVQETVSSAGEGAVRSGATDVQAYIGRQLRAVYDDVAKQPIPDRFLMLMKQLEEGPTKA